MGMVTKKKVGSISIKLQDRDGAYYVCRWSSSAQRVISEKADSFNDAVKRAAALNKLIKHGKIEVATVNEKLGIRDAMERAFAKSRSRSPQHQENQRDNMTYFIDWLSVYRPEIARWNQITYEVVCDYIEYLRDVKKIKSPKTVENYCGIIGLTSKYWSRHHPRLYVPIPITHPWFSEWKPEKKYLSPAQALDLLNFAQTRSSKTDTGLLTVALGCFAGLNLAEIVRLRVGDFTVDGKILSVNIHESKNEDARPRPLPLVEIIHPIIKASIADRSKNELLIRTTSSKTPTWRTLGSNLHYHLLKDAARELKCQEYEWIAPKNVRTTFAHLMELAKVPKMEREAYFGHSPRTTFGKFYGNLELIEIFQERVVDPLNLYIAKLQKKHRPKDAARTEMMKLCGVID